MLNGLALGALAAPLAVELSSDEPGWEGLLVGVEALALTGFLTELAKHTTGRQRPYGYAVRADVRRFCERECVSSSEQSGLDYACHSACVQRQEPGGSYRSFFSGHTSMALFGGHNVDAVCL